MANKRLLNIGCGRIFHPEWVNIDIFPNPPHVEAVDIRKGLPYGDSTFDSVYSAHLLEHLKRGDGEALLREALRVLKPGGVIRLSVPDLEGIARCYLDKLSALADGEASATEERGAEEDYDWMVLELIDQVGRDVSGGEMERFILDEGIGNKDFLLSRAGSDVEEYWRARSAGESKFSEKVKGLTVASFIRGLRNYGAGLFVRIIGGPEAASAYREGIFRASGQVHRWMYDRYSLKRLLEEAGAVGVEVKGPTESAIEDFNRYELDVIDGKVRKPDSLFMEGVKG